MARKNAAGKPAPKRTYQPVGEALLLALPYLAVGSLWIAFSDMLLPLFKHDPGLMLLVSNVKGWFYVLITAALLFQMVLSRARRIRHYQDHLEDMIRERTAEYEQARQEALDYSAQKDKAMQRMAHLSEFEGIILHLSHEFINVPVWEVQGKLEESLARIGQYLNEDRMFFAVYDYARRRCVLTADWNPSRPTPVTSPGFVTPFDAIADMIGQHERSEVYYIPNAAVYETNGDFHATLLREEITSFLAIPILGKDRPLGFVGISSRGSVKAWQEDELSLMRIFAAMIRNVYERRDRALAVLSNSRNMRTILDSTDNGILLIDRAGTIIEINEAAATLLNMTVQQATGGRIQELISAAAYEQTGPVLWETFETGKPGHFLGQRGGRWIDTRYYPVFDADGAVSAVASFATDITERINAENEIYRSRQMLREVIDSAPVGIYWRDTDNRLLGMNKVGAEIAGLSMEDLASGRGDSLRTVAIADEQADDNMQLLRSSVAKLNYEATMVNAKDQTRVLRMSKVPLLDREGKPYMLLGLMEDITAQKEMIHELIEARQDAFAASKAKSEFLSMMSHEIRSPLNSIIGLTHVAMRTDSPAQVWEYLEKIDAASKHLLGIINDILDISRIEAGKMTVSRKEFDFEAMVEEATEIVQPKVNEKRQNLNVFIDRRIPQRILSDPLRMKQVLLNLLTNAVKFTPAAGTIVIRANLRREAEGMLLLEISVSDNGIGIPDDMLGRLFAPFEQMDKKITREFGGTGLGLAISKSIVELMGGKIGVNSKEGVGSEFVFTLPVEPACVPQAVQEIGFDELNVLVVDDERETCEYMAALLGDFAVRFDTALGSAEAIERAGEAMRESRPYNVAFVDWRMPGMNGIDTAREIRRICGGETYVIMISKYDFDESEARLREAGISLFLPKPIFPSRLLATLREITHSARRAPVVEHTDMQGAFCGKRILVVEDMDINQIIIREMLRDTGAEILTAMDGAQALDVYEGAGGRIDAVLMDVQMPNMDGYEATRAIRASGMAGAGTVAIIAMTAHVYKEDIEAAAQAGMNDHIGKPIDFDSLFEKLLRYLG